MADLLVLEEQYARVRRERVFRDRRDLLMESDAWLISRFRLPRHVIIELCNNLDARLKRETRRSNALPVPVQVLATLGFLATGTFQREIGDRAGVSQPTISRTMPAVLAAIKSLSRKYIRFPYNDAQQSAPSMNDYAFINRKNYHSINVQVICDAKLPLLNVVAGGTHTILLLFKTAVLARGDKGYPLTEYLITPLANPATEQERRFNSAHTRTRVTVERCFGLLKGRWLCLGPAGGTLLYTPEKVCDIILACSVLHNIALVNGVPVQPDEPMPMEPWPVQPPLGAIRRRQELIHRF
uniref:Putative nuclease HARBI1 n=1 Tax=Seriola dumerili TaxID=41447 RepID=A0A3B4VC25_SERDU